MSENVLSFVFAGIRLIGQDPKVFLESGFNLGKSLSCVREKLFLGFGQASDGSKMDCSANAAILSETPRKTKPKFR